MKPFWPREHGSWAVFLAPVLLGLFAGPAGSPRAGALFLAGALGAFLTRAPLLALARDPADARARRWLAAYGLACAACLGPLIFSGRPGLLAFAAPGAALLAADVGAQRRAWTTSWTRELLGIAGLCLGAPAAWYAARGALPARAWLLWTACALYFAGPVFHVKLAALQHRARADAAVLPRLAVARAGSVVFHAAALALAAAAVALGALSWPVLLPFGAALAKTAHRAAQGPGRVDFKALGWQELAFSALFLAAMAAGPATYR